MKNAMVFTTLILSIVFTTFAQTDCPSPSGSDRIEKLIQTDMDAPVFWGDKE